jgi:hypothetical protein
METRSLPIMLFDERKLTPSFGYVFDPKWLDPLNRSCPSCGSWHG